MHGITRRLVLIALIPAVGQGLQALETDLTLTHSADYTTNTARTETDETSEWVNTPGVMLGLSQEGAALLLDADYMFQRRIYQRDLFDDESVITGQAELVWHALPERLDFTVRNVRTEATERARQPNIESNRQTVSTTELGPTLRLRPRPNSEFQLEYLYSDMTAEETDTDNHRHMGALRYLVELSPVRSLLLQASNTRVQFENPAAPDLDVRLGRVGFEYRGSRVEYEIGAGYNETRRSQGQDTVSGAIGDASIRWNVSAETQVELTASHGIVDTSARLMTGTVGFGESVDEDTDINEVFTETILTASVSQRLGNNDVMLRLAAGEEDYEDALRDNERRSAAIGLRRNLTPRTTLSATAEHTRRKFTDEDDAYDEVRAALQLTRRMSRRFEIAIGALYEERDPDDATGLGYEEWMGRIELRYRVLGSTL